MNVRASVRYRTHPSTCTTTFVVLHLQRARYTLTERPASVLRESDDSLKRERELALLLDYLQRTRGLDLSGYKRVGLLHRHTKRIRDVGVEGSPTTWTFSNRIRASTRRCSTRC